jgi:beta-lactamase class A/beta-lactamase class A CARB-5
MKKRHLLWIAVALTASMPVFAFGQGTNDGILDAVKAQEQKLDARIGVAISDLQTGRIWEHRSNERFPMASTFKVLACAALLSKRDEAGEETISVSASDLVPYSPVTEQLVGQVVKATDMCAATMRTSDNTAANMVLAVVGGPTAVNSFLRSIGDFETRLDRVEPEVNQGLPEDPRDTTTPKAISATLRSLVLGDALRSDERETLTSWLLSNEVGGPLLRAAVPPSWKVADRTGAGGYGTRSIVAVMWPPGKLPVVAAIYITNTEATIEQRNAAIADIGKAIVMEVGTNL